MKKNSLIFKIVFFILLVLIIVFIICYKSNYLKKEQSKNDALVIYNMALLKYIENNELNNDDNVAVTYDIKELDKMGSVLTCPFSKVEYESDSKVLVHYDKLTNEITINEELLCNKYAINYNCVIKNDIYKSSCNFDIHNK